MYSQRGRDPKSCLGFADLATRKPNWRSSPYFARITSPDGGGTNRCLESRILFFAPNVWPYLLMAVSGTVAHSTVPGLPTTGRSGKQNWKQTCHETVKSQEDSAEMGGWFSASGNTNYQYEARNAYYLDYGDTSIMRLITSEITRNDDVLIYLDRANGV